MRAKMQQQTVKQLAVSLPIEDTLVSAGQDGIPDSLKKIEPVRCYTLKRHKRPIILESLHFMIFFHHENTPVKRKRRFNWAGEISNALLRRPRGTSACAAGPEIFSDTLSPFSSQQMLFLIFRPNIPLFQHSIIPSKSQTPPAITSKPGSLVWNSLDNGQWNTQAADNHQGNPVLFAASQFGIRMVFCKPSGCQGND